MCFQILSLILPKTSKVVAAILLLKEERGRTTFSWLPSQGSKPNVSFARLSTVLLCVFSVYKSVLTILTPLLNLKGTLPGVPRVFTCF